MVNFTFPSLPSFFGLGGSSAATTERSFSLDPLIPLVNRILKTKDFIMTFKKALDCLDSSALANVTVVSLKSVPYIRYGKSRVVGRFDNGLACRLRYFEAAWMSVASVMYNVVFAVVFTLATIVTIGKVRIVFEQMRKHWMHSVFAVAALVISVTGTFSPEHAFKMNTAGLAAITAAYLQWTQGDLITNICKAYQRNKRDIKNAVQQGIQGTGLSFSRDFEPAFAYLDKNLTKRVVGWRAFAQVLRGAYSRLPNIAPSITPDLVFNTVRQAIAEFRDGRLDDALTVVEN